MSAVRAINKVFDRAQLPITKEGLRRAVRAARSDDGQIDAMEKDTIARRWSLLFTGTGWLATPAAQREYARLKHQLGLPEYGVF